MYNTQEILLVGTVAHGLSQTPDFVIVKQISGTNESWRVRHAHSGDLSKTLYLNQTIGNTSNTEYISDAGAATITLSSGLNGINSGSNYIVYSGMMYLATEIWQIYWKCKL